MIELFTGIPGSGKSLANVLRLRDLHKRWESHPHEARPVYVYNIPDLKLPHLPVPLTTWKAGPKAESLTVVDWDSMAENSIVLIDECAKLFPPRSSASAMPPYVEFLTVHRKRGFDIWFTTQNPKFVDHGLRGLVGRHQYYRRIFGMERSIVYEWDACSDAHAGVANAVKSYFSFPKDIYPLYKSAEIHTKQKFRFPIWVALPFIGLAGMLFFFPKAYGVLFHGVHHEAEAQRPAAAPLAVAPSPVVAVSSTPVSAVPAAVTMRDQVSTQSLGLISACLASATHCKCYNSFGMPLALTDFQCRSNADHLTDKYKLVDEPSTASSL